MTGKARVSQLASELGVTNKDILAKLTEFGEFVKSPASTVEAPVARRVRESFGQPHQVVYRPAGHRTAGNHPFRTDQPATAQGYPRDIPSQRTTTRSTPSPVGPRKYQRKWYRGPELSDFTRYLADELLVTRRDPYAPVPPLRHRYWEDEVAAARKYEATWATTMLDGFDWADIVDWIRAFPDTFIWPAPPEIDLPAAAVSLHLRGVAPTEIGWSYEDDARGTLAERFRKGHLTLEEVIEAVRARR